MPSTVPLYSMGKMPIMASLLAFGLCAKAIAGRFKAAKDLET
jgi:hypothetical protein